MPHNPINAHIAKINEPSSHHIINTKSPISTIAIHMIEITSPIGIFESLAPADVF